MAITGYDPTTYGPNLKYSTWAGTIYLPAYEHMTFISKCEPLGRPYAGMTVRLWDELTPGTLAANSAGAAVADLTWESGTPSKQSLTPSAVYVAVSYPEHEQDYVEQALDTGIRQNIEAALGGYCDYIAAAAISSLSAGVGDAAYHITANDLRSQLQALRIAAPDIMVGDVAINAVLHPACIADLAGINEYTFAEYRGDAENPQVRGMFVKSQGTLFSFTSNVPTGNSNGGEGAIFGKDCFGIGWNQKPKMIRDMDGLAHLHIGYANLGSVMINADRGRYIRTVTS